MEASSVEPLEAASRAPQAVAPEPAWQRADSRAAAALAGLAALGVAAASLLLHDALWPKVLHDQWFSSDTTRVLSDMFVYDANHYRTKVHPLFVLLTMPLGLLLTKAFGMGQAGASIAINAGVAAAWAAALFATLRSMRLARIDAGLFTAVGLSAASSLFWFTVPETYALGSLSLLLPALLVARSARAPVSDLALCSASGFSLSVTVTNWMSGVLATVLLRPPVRAVWLGFLTTASVTAAWAVQRVVWPTAGGHFLRQQGGEADYLFMPILGGPFGALRAMLAHGVVMPEVQLFENARLTVQPSAMFGGALQSLAVLAWLALLLLGARELARGDGWPRLRLFLAGLAAGQLLLHMAYGDENFLYSMHTSLPLVLIAGLSARGPLLRAVRPLACALIVLLLVNNGTRLAQAAHFEMPTRIATTPAAK